MSGLPEPPTHIPIPPHYKKTDEERRNFLKSLRTNTSYNLALLPDDILNEAAYYAYNLNVKLSTRLQKEQFQRIRPPFRLPINARPDKLHQACIPPDTLMQLLLEKIVKNKNAEKYYKLFVDVFLTDWIDRKGFIDAEDQHMINTPYYDSVEFLKELEKQIETAIIKLQKEGIQINQYIYKILSRIQKRREDLAEEDYNTLTRRNREKAAATTKKGGVKRRHRRTRRARV